MKKITSILILAILSFGTASLFAGGDEWSTIQDAKAEKAKNKVEDKKQDAKDEKKKKADQ